MRVPEFKISKNNRIAKKGGTEITMIKHRLALFLLLSFTFASIVQSSPQYLNLTSWITHNNGFIHPSIAICQSRNHRQGVCSIPSNQSSRSQRRPPIQQGDIVAIIPPRVLINTKTAVHYSKTARKLHERWSNVPVTGSVAAFDHVFLQRVLLSVFLLEQTKDGARSPFYSYIEQLPSSMAHLPVFWSQEKLTLALQTSPMIQILGNIRKHIEQGYTDGICAVDPVFCQRFSMDQYKWAIGTVRSRAFETEQGDVVLIPLGDAFNHNATSSVSWEMKEGHVVLRARHLLTNNVELSLNYGTLDASKMLAVYGFVHNISVWRATVLVPPNKQFGTPLAAFQLTTEIDAQAADLIHFVCQQQRRRWQQQQQQQQQAQPLPSKPTTTRSIKDRIQMLHDLVVSHMKESSNLHNEIELHHAQHYRAGEIQVLKYWKTLTEEALHDKNEEQTYPVGKNCYMVFGDHFELVRVVNQVDYDTVDVMFPSGTRVTGVKKDQLLGEVRYLQYLVSF